MADIETLPADTRYFTEVAAPSTPSTGQGVLYAAADGTLHYLNDAATDLEIGAGGVADQGTVTYFDLTEAAAPGTPAAGKVRWYAKTDGSVASKDDAGAETVHGAAGGSIATAHATRTGGNLTLNSTAWADVDSGIDLTIAAVAGDVLAVNLSCFHGAEAVGLILDAYGTTGNNYITGGGGAGDFGVMAWYGTSSTGGSSNFGGGGTQMYTVVGGDLSGGNMVLRLRYRTTAASNKTLLATTVYRLHWGVINLGQ